ncbi:MAG: uroporphyrinogen decarboxylase family protein [Fimbriimonadaceae bacterium]|nr:uroporphyrinogen decarboxylase family protein [Fimbriimonadaceae bacterium]
MIPLDLGRFWQENEASVGRAFSTDKPRAPIFLPLDDHWLLDEMQVPSTVRFYSDPAYRAEVHRACNDRCEEWIGLRPFSEAIPEPEPDRIEVLFGCRTEVLEGGTPWLEPGVSSPEELADLLDDLESLDDEGLRRRLGAGPPKPISGTSSAWSRGPATVATSVLGTTEALLMTIDEEELMERFFCSLADLMVRRCRIVAAAQGRSVFGIGIADDNCALFSPELYRRFCLPVWQTLAAELAGEPGAMRYQHSDSEMRHLLPILAGLNLTACNFGPTLPVRLIREHLPDTEIQGQIAPFTLRDGGPEAVEAEVRRDFEAVGGDGGLLMTTAGSIPAGTSLAAIRCFMESVDRICRYDG